MLSYTSKYTDTKTNSHKKHITYLTFFFLSDINHSHRHKCTCTYRINQKRNKSKHTQTHTVRAEHLHGNPHHTGGRRCHTSRFTMETLPLDEEVCALMSLCSCVCLCTVFYCELYTYRICVGLFHWCTAFTGFLWTICIDSRCGYKGIRKSWCVFISALAGVFEHYTCG